MFFILSKLFWFVVQPLVAIMVLFAAGLAARAFRFRRSALVLFCLGAVLLIVAAVSPAGLLMMNVLEQRFPRPALPPTVAGIIVLGGSFDTRVAGSRGVPELNEAADRVTEGFALARRYPDAKLLFSGGVAAVFEDDIPEGEAAAQFYAAMGLARDRLLLDNKSRNTYENAEYAKALAKPNAGDVWLLVTSANHMPRAVGCFRAVGFDVLPYPTDYRTPIGALAWRPSWRLLRNLDKVDDAVREYLGLAAYYLTGRIPLLFPGPRPR